MRVSTLLDDMLCSSAVKTGMRDATEATMLANKLKIRESRETRETRDTREMREREVREREVRGRDSVTSGHSGHSGDSRDSRDRGRDCATPEKSNKTLHRPRGDRSFSPTGRASRGRSPFRPSGSTWSVQGDESTPLQTPTRVGMGTLFKSVSPPHIVMSCRPHYCYYNSIIILSTVQQCCIYRFTGNSTNLSLKLRYLISVSPPCLIYVC